MKRDLAVAGAVVLIGVAAAVAQPSGRDGPPRRGWGWGRAGQADRPPERPGAIGEMIRRLRERRLAEMEALHGRRGRTEPRPEPDRRPEARDEQRRDEPRRPMMGRHFGHHRRGPMMGRCPFGARRGGPTADRDRFGSERRSPQAPQARRAVPPDGPRGLPDVGAELRRTVEALQALQQRVRALEERLGAARRDSDSRGPAPDRRWDWRRGRPELRGGV